MCKINLEQNTGIKWELRSGVKRGSHWPKVRQSIKKDKNNGLKDKYI